MPPKRAPKRPLPEHVTAAPLLSNRPYVFKPLTFSAIEFTPNCYQPDPRIGHRIIADKDYVYMLGGHDRQETRFRQLVEVWRYTKLTRKWEKLTTRGVHGPQDVPTAYYMPTVFFLVKPKDTIAYLAGGIAATPTSDPPSYVGTNSLYLLNLPTRSWSRYNFAASEVELPLSYGLSFTHDNRGNSIFTGGMTVAGQPDLNLYCYNWSSRVWSIIAQRPEFILPRFNPEIIFHNSRLYFFGGIQTEQPFAMDQIPIYDLELKTWGQEPVQPDPIFQFPASRFGQLAFRQGTVVHIFGGQDATNLYADFWSLDLAKFAWKFNSEVQLPTAISMSSLAIYDGQVTIFGGLSGLRPATYTNLLVEMYASKKIPTLKSLATEVVFHQLDQEVWSDYAVKRAALPDHVTVKTRRGGHKKKYIHPRVYLDREGLYEKKIVEYFERHQNNVEWLNLPGYDKWKPKKAEKQEGSSK